MFIAFSGRRSWLVILALTLASVSRENRQLGLGTSVGKANATRVAFSLKQLSQRSGFRVRFELSTIVSASAEVPQSPSWQWRASLGSRLALINQRQGLPVGASVSR